MKQKSVSDRCNEISNKQNIIEKKDYAGSLPIHFDQFLAYLEALGRKPRTIGTYKQRVTPLISFLLEQGVVDTLDVKPSHIDAYIVMLRRKNTRFSAHSRRPTEKGKLSEVTIAGIIQGVKTFFNWCEKRNHVHSTPAGHLKKPSIKNNLKIKAIKQTDLEAMIKVAKENQKIRDYAILLFLADTGCRAGEICSLTLDNLDLEKNEARIDGKTGERILDFTNKTADAILDWLSIRKPVKSKAVFTTIDDNPLTYAALYLALKRIGKSAETAKYNPHAIRHRVGQGWVDSGANLEIVRQKLGHRDVSTTALFYANQDRKRIKMATQRHSLINDI